MTNKFTSKQKNLIVANLLGHATLSPLTNNGSCYLQFSHPNCQYIQHLYAIFKDWCGEPSTISENCCMKTSNISDKEAIAVSFSFKTESHPAFLFYSGQFYKRISGKRTKVVPKLLHRWLNQEVLSYWFLDTASQTNSDYLLNTQCYQYYEQVRLAKLLGEKFGLQVTILKEKDKYKLKIGNSIVLQKIVMLNCFSDVK